MASGVRCRVLSGIIANVCCCVFGFGVFAPCCEQQQRAVIWLSLESVLNDRNVVLTQRQNMCFLARCLKLVHVTLTHAERIHAHAVTVTTVTGAAVATVTDAAHTTSPGTIPEEVVAAAEVPAVMLDTTTHEIPWAFRFDAVREAPLSVLCQSCEGTLTI